MKRIVKQIARGCNTLPGVGSHPGTFIMFILIGLATAAAGVLGFIVGAAVYGPMYLYGAYCRAELSDKMTTRKSVSHHPV